MNDSDVKDANLGQVAVAAVNQYLRHARAIGLDPDAAARAAGIPAGKLERVDERITGAQFQAVVRWLTETSGDPLLGLRSGEFVQPGSYAVLGYITMSCQTLGEAIALIRPYERLVGDMGVTRFVQRGGASWLHWECRYADPLVWPQVVDNVFASWINYGRWLADQEAAAPERVELERDSPGGELEREYHRRWGCEVRFACAQNRLILKPKQLGWPLRQPDPALRRTLEEHARAEMAKLDEGESDLLTRVRNAIRRELQAGVSRQDLVAERLGMSSRTLQRRLGSLGLEYRQVLDGVRREMAEAYLRDMELPVGEIGARLGFAELRSFYRSFRRWTGTTPRAWRRQQGRAPNEG